MQLFVFRLHGVSGLQYTILYGSWWRIIQQPLHSLGRCKAYGQDPIHRNILKTKWMLQEDDDYESEEAMRYAVEKKISHFKSQWHTKRWWAWGWWWECINVPYKRPGTDGTHLTSMAPFHWWCNKIQKHSFNMPATPQMEWTHLGLYVRLFGEVTSFFKEKRHDEHPWSL